MVALAVPVSTGAELAEEILQHELLWNMSAALEGNK